MFKVIESEFIPVMGKSEAALRSAGRAGKAALRLEPCCNCDLRELCLPGCAPDRHGRMPAGSLAFTHLRLRRGERLYLTGARFTSLYAVRKGFLKTTAIIEKGRAQVTGFSMAGEVLGMDGIQDGRHTCDTVALEDGEICAFPFVRLQELALAQPGLQRSFHTLMSREIVREHRMMLLLGSMNAEERVAMFLLDLSRRFAAHGQSRVEFDLCMTRNDIGSYLGVTVGTVCRVLARFREAGLIEVRGKGVRIADRRALEGVIGA